MHKTARERQFCVLISIMDISPSLNAIHIWVARAAAITGGVTLLTPLWGFRRQDRRARAQSSGRLTHVLRWPFLLVTTFLFITAGVLLWRPIPFSLSPLWRMITLIAGSLLYFPGTALYLWGYKTLGDNFGLSSGFGATLYAGHRLIQSGPYRHIRHPMYLGVIFAAVGALLIFQTWAMLVFLPLSFGIIARARREDKLLEQAFGEQWQVYERRVPGWFPGLRREHDEQVTRNKRS